MSRIKRDLNVAQSMKELEKISTIPNLKEKSAIQIARSSKAVLERAEFEYLNGDEEHAFIFYMKYFQLIQLLKDSTTYGKDKQEIRNLVGDNTSMINYMDRLENIKTSLISRYNERTAVNDVNAINDAHKEDNSHNLMNGTVTKSAGKWISCKDLHRTMTNDSCTILLLDCREQKEYEESRIAFKNIINIPQVRKGLTASKLREQIDDSSKYLFDRRTEMDWIILIDWEESKMNQSLSKPIWVLYDVLTKWDPDARYKSEPKVLNGGFSDFLLHYPMKTTNPKYKMSPSNVLTIINMDEIEYPNVLDIKMKETTADGSPKPRIDRSNKVYAKRKFEDARRPSTTIDIVKEKEMKFEQAIKKEHEVISISNELENVLVGGVTVDDPNKKKEWFDKRMELGNKLVQKESELNDTVRELEFDEPVEFENNLRLQEKKNELIKMEKFRNEKKEGLEQKWRLTEEQQKRQHEIEEERKRPKMPTFDRSVKPINQKPQIQRDFSPVPGSYGAVGATGFKNLGNTCYMNSIIQCLLNLEPLCLFLKDGAYKHHINYKSRTQGAITEELAMVCSEAWSGKFKSISPKCLRYAIGQHQKIFRGYDQQDSHEFLTIIIDILNSELQYSIGIASDEKLSAPDQAWREFVKNKESFIQKMFFGQIRSTLKCVNCLQESPTYEGFSNLSLELPVNDKEYDLYDCLDSYFDGEYIDGWLCPKCEKNRRAIKKLDISKLPEILVIHLKRFHINLYSSSNTYQKKHNYVEFPIKDFKITDYVIPSAKHQQQSFSYDLCAVSNHYGTMERGHYTAFCKNHETKCWYKFDDNYVTKISSNEVISSAAYILFYVRK